MSSVAPPPEAPATPAPAPAGEPVAPARQRRAPDWTRGAAPLTLVIGAGLAAVCFGAGGGVSLGSRTTTEIALILAGAGLVIAALLLRPRDAPRPAAALTVALLGGLAALTALSVTWAIQPSDAWVEANRLFSYFAIFAGAAALATIAPHRWSSLIGGILIATVSVSVYALLTKSLPGWLNENELFARLREPYGYWNAVGLTGALAMPACLWLGARREGPPLLNALAYPALTLTLATTLMAYSRGSLLAAAIGAALFFILAPLRLRAATVLLIGGAGAVMIAVWAFGQDALTTDRAPLPDRKGAGGELLVLVVAVTLLIFVAGLVANFIADARDRREQTRRRTGIALLAALALVPFVAAGALATTDAGLGGSIDNAWSSLTDTSAVGPANDPGRLTATGSVRSRYWAEAFKIFKTDELTGVGAGGYATARPRFRQDQLDVRHAHGFVPETMAELGVIGILLCAALLVAWILATRRTLRSTTGSERVGMVTLAATAVVFGVHSTIDWTWSIPGTAVIGLVAAAWVASRGGPVMRLAAWRETKPLQGALAAAVLIAALVASWAVMQPLRADHAADDALAALGDKRYDAAREHALKAHDLNPLSVDPYFDLAAIEQAAGRKREGEQWLEKAAELQPSNWLPWMRLADYRLFVLDKPKTANDAVRVAIYLNPRSWDVAQRYLDVQRRLKGS